MLHCQAIQPIRSSIRRHMLLGGASLLAAMLPAAAAQAQTAAEAADQAATAPTAGQPTADPTVPAAAATDDASPAGGLGEIVVTARKRAETAQNIPVALTVISAAELQQRDLTKLEDVAAATPNFVIGRNATGSGAQLSLRGVGSNSLSIGTEQSIAVIVDGVYYGQGRTINEGFFDLAGIEILKGPQSLFYGKNATAGVISITTANPTNHFTASVRGGYEFNASKVYGEAIFSGPISDTLGFRIGVRASKDYGHLFGNVAGPITYNTRDTPTAATVATNTPHIATASPNDGPNERDLLVRGTLRWSPTDRFTATVKANFGANETRPGTWNYSVFACEGGFSTISPTVPCQRRFEGRVNNLPADIAAVTRYARADGRNFNKYRSAGATATLEYGADTYSVTSVSNYNWNKNVWSNDIDYQSTDSPGVNIWGTEDSRYSAFSSELRVLTKMESPFNFLVGAYYQNTRREFLQGVINANSENSLAPAGFRYVQYAKDSQTKGETLSGYGQVIWNIVPTVEATAGARYIHETKDSYFFQPYANPRFAGINYDVTRRLQADQTFDNWSPEATLTWKPTRDLTIYGAYRTAYKSGGFSNSSILTPATPADFFTFEPEKAKGFEAGLKTVLMDRQLRLNLAAYRFKYTDLQVTYLNSALLTYNSVNAGTVNTRGVEFDFEYAPRDVEGLRLRGSANYNKSRYGNGSIAPCYGGQKSTDGCIPNLLTTGTPGQDLKGVETSVAPLWTASLGTLYETPIGGGLVFGGSIDARYSSSYLASAFGSPLSRQPKYVNLDAGLRVHTEDDRWEFALIAKNLTNQFVITGVTDGSGTGQRTGTPTGRSADQIGFGAMPRTVQLQITWRMP